MLSVAITTICDMVAHCRHRLDDLSPVGDPPTSNQDLIEDAAEDADETELLWKTPELRHFANEAIREVAIRTRCLRDGDRNEDGVTRYPVAAGESTIAVDPRVLVIKRAWWNDTVMTPEAEFHLDEWSSSWRTDSTDCPRRFTLERSSRNLRLVGVPTVAGVVSLDVIRLPLAVIETGTPEIPQQYLADCLDWMCALAYLKNDADTANPQLSQMYAAEFERKVGPRPTNLQLELERHQSGRRRARLHYF